MRLQDAAAGSTPIRRWGRAASTARSSRPAAEPVAPHCRPRRVASCCRPSCQPHTAHTTNPVPVLVVGADVRLRPEGRLADLAPTVLDLLGVPQPAAMTGTSLVER